MTFFSGRHLSTSSDPSRHREYPADAPRSELRVDLKTHQLRMITRAKNSGIKIFQFTVILTSSTCNSCLKHIFQPGAYMCSFVLSTTVHFSFSIFPRPRTSVYVKLVYTNSSEGPVTELRNRRRVPSEDPSGDRAHPQKFGFGTPSSSGQFVFEN